MIKKQITFLDCKRQELIEIPCEEQGRCLSTCLYLLQAIYDGVTIEPCSVTITPLPDEGGSTLIDIANTEKLPPGRYQICHVEGGSLELSWNIRTIVPVGSLGRDLTEGEVRNLGIEVKKESKRLSEQKSLVSRRDQVCLMSGSTKYATLAHILARSWYQYRENRIYRLPENVRRVIETIGIDSPANGMLLRSSHAAAFDDGLFAIRLNARSQYEVVAITDEYLSYDEFPLYGGRLASEIAREDMPAMNDELLEFHLRCAVLRNMKASAQPTDPWAQHDDDLEYIAGELEKLTDLSAEDIRAGLNWWVVEQVIPVNKSADGSVSKPGLMDSAGGELTDANTSGSSDE